MSDPVEEVKRHGEKVLRREVNRPGDCPKCEKGGGRFRFHEAKPRFFLMVVMAVVRRVETYLARWKCPHCGGTFIVYPSFALPHKHYVRKEVLKRPEGYAGAEGTTYKEAASEGGMPVSYEGEAGEEKGRQMSASTVWRWVGFIAALNSVLRRARRKIRREASSWTVSRDEIAVPAGKCCSKERKKVLRHCLKVLRVEVEYQRLFGGSIFLPHFGMGGVSR